MMYAGTLSVKSSGSDEEGWSLMVEVIPPHPETESSIIVNGSKIQIDLIIKVVDLYKEYGNVGTSKNIIEKECKGVSTTKVRAAIDVAVAHGCLVRAARTQTSNVAPLRYKKDWGTKLGVRRKG